MPTIGVLAIQGDFLEHRRALDGLGVNAPEVRLPHQLEGLDGLIIPGGESTTIVQLIDIYGLRDALTAAWDGTGGVLDLPGLRAEIIIGDARQALPAWQGQVDAWFLDGFSPAKNPELWQEDLMQAVADHTASNGTAATYTAAGFVRRGLEAAGFKVERTPGFGRKRHMTQAILTDELKG